MLRVVLFPLLILSSALLQAAGTQPNIIIVMADDLGYGGLGSYGQHKIKTPNLDRLADQGLRFTQYYAGSAICAPSRAVLMLGKHPGHTTIRKNQRARSWGQMPLPSEDITIAELLKKQGYTTGVFGKWSLGIPGSSGDPLVQGFDKFFGYYDQGNAHSYYPSHLWENGKKVPLNNTHPIPGHASLPAGADSNDVDSYRIFKGKDYAPDHIHDAALNFVRENVERPFFLYYATILPHLALQIPEADLVAYLREDWIDEPSSSSLSKRSTYTPHLKPKAAYAAMTTRLDTYVGRLMAELDVLDISDNTIFIFISDNGPVTYHNFKQFFSSAGVFRGAKGSLYEGGVRVPAIVRWPGRVAAGTTTDFVSGAEDWLPTALAIADATATIPEDVDGLNLLPILYGKDATQRKFLYRELPKKHPGQQFVRVGKWKAIRPNLSKRSDIIELYNLDADPGEQKNVAVQNSEIVNELVKIMDREHEPSEAFPLPSDKEH
jgi:arylsulfatase A